ncbi:hypothetical protein BJ546DRAFT_592703 [Cryomyces antarcticus]
MDISPDWAASALFSPSKARQQAAQAKDWAYVDGWLAAKYAPKPAPAFERNSDTLTALLALAAGNEEADERREMVERVEEEALREAREVADMDPNADIYDAITDSLTAEGQQALSALADLSVALDAPSVDSESLAARVTTLTLDAHTLHQQTTRLAHLTSTLTDTLSRLRALLTTLRSPAFAAPSALPQQTALWTREARQLRQKIAEYRDRLSALSSTAPSLPSGVPTVQRAGELEEEVTALRERVKALEAEVGRFKGLPPDRDLARLKVKEARVELAGVRRERDGVFEGLVGG